MKERNGLNKKASQRLAEIAYEKGLKHKDLCGSIKRYIDKIYLSHWKGNEISIYGDKIYIFHNGICITLLPLPNKYKRDIENLKK